MDAGSGNERQHHAGGKAVGVIQRQWIEHLVRRRKIEHGADLRDVGDDGAMRQHDPLGPILRS